MAEEKQQEEKPLTREDVLRLIKENGGTAKGLDLSGKTFETGIDLRELDLEGIILKKALLVGANLEGANLSGAELQDVHLVVSNLRKANLQFAELQGAQLLGTTLRQASLWRVRLSSDTELVDVGWGNYVLAEETKGDFFSAEETYRMLKLWYTNAGMSNTAAKFYYREKEASRKSLKLYSRHRLALEFLRALFGYGEGWKRVLASIAVLILLFALTYCAIGSVWEWSAFGNSLYFSAVSFTALGYGSWVQVTNGWIKGIGAFESLVGVSMMALLLVTFFRKWTR